MVRVEVARPWREAEPDAVQTSIGLVRAENETELGFKVGGILERIGPEPGRHWGEGDRFDKDQVLAQLVQVDFVAERDSAAARRDLAESRLARAEQLRRDGAISPQEYDTLKAARDEAVAAFERARQAWMDSTLRAPFAGHVLALEAAVRRQHPSAVNTVQIGVVALLSPAVALATPFSLKWTAELVVALAITGVLASALAFAAMARVLLVLKAGETGVILAFEPVAAAVVSVLLGYEPVTTSMLFGGLLVVSGVALVAGSER